MFCFSDLYNAAMDEIAEICQDINLLGPKEKQDFFDELVEHLDQESIACLERALDVVI